MVTCSEHKVHSQTPPFQIPVPFIPFFSHFFLNIPIIALKDAKVLDRPVTDLSFANLLIHFLHHLTNKYGV